MVAASQRGYEKRAKRQIRGPAQCNCCLCGRGSNRNPYAYFAPKDDLERRRADYDRAYAPYPRGGGQREIDYADDYPPPAPPPRQPYRPYAAEAAAAASPADAYPTRFRSYAGEADAPVRAAAAPPAYADFRTRGAFGSSTRDDPYPYEHYPSSAPARFRGEASPRAGDPYAYADYYAQPPASPRMRVGDPYGFADAYYPPPPARPRFRSYGGAETDPAPAAGDPPEEYAPAPARPRFRSYGADISEQPAAYPEEYQPPPARQRFRSYGGDAVDPAPPFADPYSYPDEYLPPAAYPLALPKRG